MENICNFSPEKEEHQQVNRDSRLHTIGTHKPFLKVDKVVWHALNFVLISVLDKDNVGHVHTQEWDAGRVNFSQFLLIPLEPSLTRGYLLHLFQCLLSLATQSQLQSKTSSVTVTTME